MIIYSTVPMEVIFENQEQVEKQQIHELSIGHATMLVEPTSSFAGRIIRLISPDPQDYLNPRYQPGETITFRPDMS